jgi:hypothetical protein
MTVHLVRFGLAIGVLVAGTVVCAADPPPDENLPLPRMVDVPPVMPGPSFNPYGYYRVNRWDTWQYYDVDRRGGFRPRVIYSPYGSYYLYNGAPYPWVSTHQRDITPRIVGTPYRDYMPYIID